MNPSTSGWIHKFINEFPKKLLIDNYASPDVFYVQLKKTGFIYGVSVSTLLDEPISHYKLTKEEFTKINLFHALWFTFFSENPKEKHDVAIEAILTFYESIERGKRSFFQKLSFSTSPSENLEKILTARMQETNHLLKSEDTSLITHALLYVDVLAFMHYLQKPDGMKQYLDRMEMSLLEHSARALKSKKEKNKYDLLVIDLVSSSSEFFFAAPYTLHGAHSPLEKKFILDIACLAVWDDKVLDDSERVYLKQLGRQLGFTPSQIEQNMDALIHFSETNAQKMKLFQYAHPVAQFYKQSSKTVKLLILRNKKRLTTELNESGELLLLLGQSTSRELTQEEKSKVKEQLLDIFKTIPSLTIFMLPGGALLLPLFVKLIPKLLPSAFHENRVDSEKK